MRHCLFVLLLSTSFFVQVYCSVASASDYMVDEKWLTKNLGDPNIVIIDAGTPTEYALGHIAGAISVPSQATFSKTAPTDRLAPESEINKLFSQAGISNKSTVVVYDHGQFKFAARLWWSLHVNGHNNVTILRTDYPSWETLGLPLAKKPTILESSTFVSRIQPERIATSFQTLLATHNPSVTIVDVRELHEYRGEASRSRRYGHIPTAISIDWHDMSTQEGDINRLKSVEELRDLFGVIDSNDSVITYCQQGHEAALAYFALSRMGHEVRLYDGSWHEWGNSSNLPVEGPDSSPAIPIGD